MVNVVLRKKRVHLLILWSARVSNQPFFDIRGSTSFFLPRSPRETMEMIEWWRVPNRVLQSRNPEGYFCHPTREYFQSRVSPRFCFKISDPEIQTRLIPYPEKPLGDPLLVIEVSLKRQLTVIKAQACQATNTKSVRKNSQNCRSIFSVQNRYFPSA